MNMHWVDWVIVASFMVGLAAVAIYVGRFNRSVAGFLAANRCAGRYLLSISQGIAGLGAISVIAHFEMFYKGGFSAGWWHMMIWPVWLLVSLSGWVAYRYRETRVMTMAQLFEIRYSRSFRVFCGIVAWVSGVINMGIFPAVTANFFIYFCGLPPTFFFLGIEVSTFVTIMIVELSVAMLFTFWGGMIVVVITDFIQGVFSYLAFLIIMVVLFLNFDWNQVVTALKTAPENASLINPYKMGDIESFNLGYFLIVAVSAIYGWKAWQGKQGYNAAPKNAHEAKMTGIISIWRELILMLLLLMVPIFAFTLLNSKEYAGQAQIVQSKISSIEDQQLQEQMTVPLALTQILPVGLIGLFAAIMLAAAISTDDTYFHSWGTILVQDVILPFKKSGFTPKQHMWLLRASIALVGTIVFFFSYFFKQNDHIMMYLALAGAIYLGGAGAAIIGGLYWKRGSTAGAWGAMIVGGFLACGGLALQAAWPQVAPTFASWFPENQFLAAHPDKFPFDGVRINFFAIVCSITTYIGLSLWTWLVLHKPAFDLDRMLHRGQHAMEGEHNEGVTSPETGLKALLPGKEYKGMDRFLHISLTVWIVGWSLFFAGVTVYHLSWGTTDAWWVSFWPFYICLNFILGTVATVWFLIGGLSDLRYLIRALQTAHLNSLDDGRVVNHQSVVDAEALRR